MAARHGLCTVVTICITRTLLCTDHSTLDHSVVGNSTNYRSLLQSAGDIGYFGSTATGAGKPFADSFGAPHAEAAALRDICGCTAFMQHRPCVTLCLFPVTGSDMDASSWPPSCARSDVGTCYALACLQLAATQTCLRD